VMLLWQDKTHIISPSKNRIKFIASCVLRRVTPNCSDGKEIRRFMFTLNNYTEDDIDRLCDMDPDKALVS